MPSIDARVAGAGDVGAHDVGWGYAATCSDATPFFRRAGFDDAGLLRRGRMG